MNIKQPFPALPDYDGPTSGLFGLVHHDKLFEYSRDILERVEFYNTGGKPEHELETRRRCLVYLDPTGQPWAVARAKCGADWAKYVAVRADYGADWANYVSVRDKYDADWAKYVAARDKYDADWAEYEAATAEYASQIEAQIRALVPDLPWNGKELVFPKEVKE